jgi:general secretion pathway protein D
MLSYRPADADFVTKLFQVKPNAFFTELIKVKSTIRQVSPLPTTPLGEGFDSAIRSKDTQSSGGKNLYINRQTGQPLNGGGGFAAGSGGGEGGVNSEASAAVQAYLANFGINNAQVVFNPSNGQLLVRAQLANLEQIEQVIEILNTSPEQLVIEAKFAEIEFNEGESLGFDWYLGNFLMQDGKYITGAGPQPTFIGKPTASNPSGFFPYPGTLQGNTFVPSQYSLPPSPNEGHLTSAFKGYGNPLWTFTGLMTDPQFRVVLNAIDQQDGAELLSAPRILAISGRQASIAVQDNRSIVTGVTPSFNAGQGGGFGGGGAAGGGVMMPTVTQQQMGPSLTVLPYVNADGYTIEMSIAPPSLSFWDMRKAPLKQLHLPAKTW